MATESKYGTVTTEKGNIPESEPVFLFRAQDALVPAVLAFYEALCTSAGCHESHINSIDLTRRDILQWQAMNYTKLPGKDAS